MTGHLGENDAAAYLDHRCSARRKHEIETHLAACEECLALIADVAAALESPLPLGRGFAPERTIPSRPSFRWRPAVSLAAALLVAVVSLVVVWRGNRSVPWPSESDKGGADRVLGEDIAVAKAKAAVPAPSRQVAPKSEGTPITRSGEPAPPREHELGDAAAEPEQDRVELAPESLAKSEKKAAAATPGVPGKEQPDVIAPLEIPAAAPRLARSTEPLREENRAARERKGLDQGSAVAGGVSPGPQVVLDPRLRLEGEVSPADLLERGALEDLLGWDQEVTVRFVVDGSGRIGAELEFQPELPPVRAQALRAVLDRLRFTPSSRIRRRGVLVLLPGNSPAG